MLKKIKLIRITTVPISLDKLLKGQLKFMQMHGFEVYMASSWAENIYDIEERELSKFFPVNMTRTISPIKDVVSLIKLIRIFRRLKPTIVHTHTPKAGLLGMMAAWVTKVPVRLHTVAGLPLMETGGVKRKVLELTERLTYYFAVKVYPNSKNLKQFILKSSFCNSDKLKVIGNGSSNGIDTGYFKLNPSILQEAGQLKEKFSITEANFVFIFIGRLVKDKGIEELIKAFSLLNNLYPDTRLLLIGPFEPELDPLSNNCTQEIQNNKAIINCGFQNDVRPYLAASNALVFPSYREGFPNVPMQAGCFDLPCIVTDINGCNEIIENETNGLIIPSKDEEALQKAMTRIMEDKLLYGKLQSNARKMIVERYDQTYFWSLLLQEYHDQLNEKGIIQ
jgi:glycosyltransferase involved in cell wall biosynthesis